MKKFVAVLIIAVMAFALSACGRIEYYEYDDAELYSVGGQEVNLDGLGEIKSVEINWLDGEVNVVSGETLSVKEETAVGEEYLPFYYRADDEGALMIKNAKSGSDYSAVKNQKKKLTVTVPETVHSVDLVLSRASYNVTASSVNVVVVDSSVGSGAIDCEYLSAALVTSISGNVKITAKAQLVAALVCVTVSGNAEVALDSVEDINLSFTSVSGHFESDFEGLKEAVDAANSAASSSASSSGDENATSAEEENDDDYYEYNGKKYKKFTVSFTSISGSFTVNKIA